MEQELIDHIITNGTDYIHNIVINHKYTKLNNYKGIDFHSLVIGNLILCISDSKKVIIYKNKMCIICRYSLETNYYLIPDILVNSLSDLRTDTFKVIMINVFMCSIKISDNCNLSIDWLFSNNSVKSARAII